jgi:hypothetical protein
MGTGFLSETISLDRCRFETLAKRLRVQAFIAFLPPLLRAFDEALGIEFRCSARS